MCIGISRKEGGEMSLFGEQSTVHSKEQQRKTTLAELAGGGIGAGAGLIASKLGNLKYQERALKSGLSQTKDIQNAEKHWKTMLDLTNGKLTMQDVPFNKREFYQKQMEENTDDLNYMKEHPSKSPQLLQELGRGKVEKLFPDQAEPSKIKQLMDSFKKKQVVLGGNVEPLFAGAQEERMFFPHTLENPALHSLPAFMGLAGMYGAGVMARKHFDKENEGQQEEHDLNRLQELLLALKAKDSQSKQ